MESTLSLDSAVATKRNGQSYGPFVDPNGDGLSYRYILRCGWRSNRA